MKHPCSQSFKRVLSVSVIILLLLIYSTSVLSQTSAPSNDDRVLVNSWKLGNGKIQEQTKHLTLDANINEYEYEIFDASKERRFRLSFRREDVKTLKQPFVRCWFAAFREVSKDRRFGGNLVGYDLFDPTGPGTGDYFPQEAWASVFGPIEKPNRLLDGHLYPIKMERIFLIEKFVVILRVTDYQYDSNENKLNKLDLVVEVKNQ